MSRADPWAASEMVRTDRPQHSPAESVGQRCPGELLDWPGRDWLTPSPGVRERDWAQAGPRTGAATHPLDMQADGCTGTGSLGEQSVGSGSCSQGVGCREHPQQTCLSTPRADGVPLRRPRALVLPLALSASPGPGLLGGSRPFFSDSPRRKLSCSCVCAFCSSTAAGTGSCHSRPPTAQRLPTAQAGQGGTGAAQASVWAPVSTLSSSASKALEPPWGPCRGPCEGRRCGEPCEEGPGGDLSGCSHRFPTYALMSPPSPSVAPSS